MTILTPKERDLLADGRRAEVVKAVQRRLFPNEPGGLTKALRLVTGHVSEETVVLSLGLDSAEEEYEIRLSELADAAHRMRGLLLKIEQLRQARLLWAPGDTELADSVDDLLAEYDQLQQGDE